MEAILCPESNILELCEPAAGKAFDLPEPVVYFRLAQSACQKGLLQESHSWWRQTLRLAKLLGTEKEWKQRALRDKDLQPLWTDPKVEWPAWATS